MRYQQVLGENLRGLYVHGSIAMGCFNPDSSDVDLLAVVQSPLSLATKQALGDVHIQLADTCPNPLEVSIVLQSVLEDFSYPAPFEFHYSREFLDAFRAKTIDLTTPRTDPDLAAHFVIAKAHGIALLGEPAAQVFPDVPDAAYLDAIAEDAAWSINNVLNGADDGLCRVPQYAVLNFCRVLAFIHESRVTSKRTGAEWALSNVPENYHAVIQAALTEYTTAGSAQPVPCKMLKAFAHHTQTHIERATSPD
jgi:streptomycin 3"-adenylyltransferase